MKEEEVAKRIDSQKHQQREHEEQQATQIQKSSPSKDRSSPMATPVKRSKEKVRRSVISVGHSIPRLDSFVSLCSFSSSA